MRYITAFVFAAVLSLSARLEAAPVTTVIDFNAATPGVFSTLVLGDFTFTWVGFGDRQEVGVLSPGNNALMDSVVNVGGALGASVVMSMTNGSAFTVTQFDIIQQDLGRGVGLNVDFGGVTYWAPATQTVLRGDLVDLTSVSIGILSAYDSYAIDNIHVTFDDPTIPDPPVDPPTTVPEPATLSLVALGAIGIISRVRRQ